MSDFVIRPTFVWRLPSVRELAVVLGPLAIVLAVSELPLSRILTAVASGAPFAAALVGWTLLYGRVSRFGVLDAALVYRGVRRTQTLASTAGVVRVTRVERRNREHGAQIWVGDVGSRYFDEAAWARDDLAALASVIGATVVEDPEPATARELAERYPEAGLWWDRHPVAFRIGSGIVIALLLATFGSYD